MDQGARGCWAPTPRPMGLAFSPAPIPGLGTSGGFQFELQDPLGHGERRRPGPDRARLRGRRARAAGAHGSLQLVQRQRAPDPVRSGSRQGKTLGVPISQIFQALQIYLGGLQVNDLTLFGRPFKVMVQAEPEFRVDPDNLRDIYVRSAANTMVPLRTMANIASTTGPDLIQRYNMFRCTEISGANAAGYSSGQALAAMEEVADEVLGDQYGYEWTGTAYQEKLAGGEQVVIFALGFLLVFLFLAANYESWVIPARRAARSARRHLRRPVRRVVAGLPSTTCTSSSASSC